MNGRLTNGSFHHPKSHPSRPPLRLPHVPLKNPLFFFLLLLFPFLAPLDFQMRGKCSILSDITALIRSPHASFLPLSIIFAPGSGPSPGRSRWEIMQADNASRQSITLMARTTMPRRFRTNFRLLQLSICTRSSQPERRKRKGWGVGRGEHASGRIPVFSFRATGIRRVLLGVFVSF